MMVEPHGTTSTMNRKRFFHPIFTALGVAGLAGPGCVPDDEHEKALNKNQAIGWELAEIEEEGGKTVTNLKLDLEDRTRRLAEDEAKVSQLNKQVAAAHEDLEKLRTEFKEYRESHPLEEAEVDENK